MDLKIFERNVTLLFQQPIRLLELSPLDFPEEFSDVEIRQGRDGTIYLTSLQTGTEIVYIADRVIVRARGLQEERSTLIPTLTMRVITKAKDAKRKAGETEERFIRAYGLNYHAQFPTGTDRAGKFLAKHLLQMERIEKVLPVLATKITMQSSQENPRYQLGFEPRQGNVEAENCYCQLNVHYEQELPEETELQQQLSDGEGWLREHLKKLFPEVFKGL